MVTYNGWALMQPFTLCGDEKLTTTLGIISQFMWVSKTAKASVLISNMFIDYI